MLGFLENLNKQLAGKGIPVDFGESAVVELNVTGDVVPGSIALVNPGMPTPQLLR